LRLERHRDESCSTPRFATKAPPCPPTDFARELVNSFRAHEDEIATGDFNEEGEVREQYAHIERTGEGEYQVQLLEV
jgi:hypothetical protein